MYSGCDRIKYKMPQNFHMTQKHYLVDKLLCEVEGNQHDDDNTQNKMIEMMNENNVNYKKEKKNRQLKNVMSNKMNI